MKFWGQKFGIKYHKFECSSFTVKLFVLSSLVQVYVPDYNGVRCRAGSDVIRGVQWIQWIRK